MSTALNSIMQYAYVVPNCELAALSWAQKLGVGPFYMMEDVKFDQLYYLGIESKMKINVAIAYSQGVQIELVQPLDNCPSMFNEFLMKCPEGGLQHIGMISKNLDNDVELLGGDDNRIQWGKTAAGMRFAYMDTSKESHKVSQQSLPIKSPINLPIVELIEANDEILFAFSKMEAAANNWQGEHPIRGKQSGR